QLLDVVLAGAGQPQGARPIYRSAQEPMGDRLSAPWRLLSRGAGDDRRAPRGGGARRQAPGAGRRRHGVLWPELSPPPRSPAGRDATEHRQIVEDAAAPLREAWYYAVPSRRLRRRAMLAKVMLGEPILIGRDSGGARLPLRDLCPHRGMRLTAGHFDGREVECCYHGWRFDTGGP